MALNEDSILCCSGKKCGGSHGSPFRQEWPGWLFSISGWPIGWLRTTGLQYIQRTAAMVNDFFSSMAAFFMQGTEARTFRFSLLFFRSREKYPKVSCVYYK
jgi:hypothetical protein